MRLVENQWRPRDICGNSKGSAWPRAIFAARNKYLAWYESMAMNRSQTFPIRLKAGLPLRIHDSMGYSHVV